MALAKLLQPKFDDIYTHNTIYRHLFPPPHFPTFALSFPSPLPSCVCMCVCVCVCVYFNLLNLTPCEFWESQNITFWSTLRLNKMKTFPGEVRTMEYSSASELSLLGSLAWRMASYVRSVLCRFY